MNGRLYKSIRSRGQSPEETVRRHMGPSEFGEGGPGSGVHSWICIVQKVVKAGHWDPHHCRTEESGSKKPQVGFSSSCLGLLLCLTGSLWGRSSAEREIHVEVL